MKARARSAPSALAFIGQGLQSRGWASFGQQTAFLCEMHAAARMRLLVCLLVRVHRVRVRAEMCTWCDGGARAIGSAGVWVGSSVCMAQRAHRQRQAGLCV